MNLKGFLVLYGAPSGAVWLQDKISFSGSLPDMNIQISFGSVHLSGKKNASNTVTRNEGAEFEPFPKTR